MKKINKETLNTIKHYTSIINPQIQELLDLSNTLEEFKGEIKKFYNEISYTIIGKDLEAYEYFFENFHKGAKKILCILKAYEATHENKDANLVSYRSEVQELNQCKESLKHVETKFDSDLAMMELEMKTKLYSLESSHMRTIEKMRLSGLSDTEINELLEL